MFIKTIAITLIYLIKNGIVKLMNQNGFAPIIIILIGAVIGVFSYAAVIGFPEKTHCGEVLSCHGIPAGNTCIGNKSTFMYVDCVNTNSSTISPSPISSDETANWNIYTNNELNISFRYPHNWQQKTQILLGSGMQQEFGDSTYTLTFSSRANYNNKTGKPFKDLDEYLNQTTGKIRRIVAGHDAIQSLPRAGSENVYAIDFFSQDGKNIFTLELAPKVNDPSKDMEEKGIFDKILSTFAFSQQQPKATPLQVIDITEAGNGKTFTYPLDERFSVDLDSKKHPLKNLVTDNCPFGYVSNLSLNGPDSYPIGFQTLEKGSCVIRNGDFSATIKVIENSN